MSLVDGIVGRNQIRKKVSSPTCANKPTRAEQSRASGDKTNSGDGTRPTHYVFQRRHAPLMDYTDNRKESLQVFLKVDLIISKKMRIFEIL